MVACFTNMLTMLFRVRYSDANVDHTRLPTPAFYGYAKPPPILGSNNINTDMLKDILNLFI